jgi:hypothetical protein
MILHFVFLRETKDLNTGVHPEIEILRFAQEDLPALRRSCLFSGG